MEVEYRFNFEDYDDFDKFLDKHSDVINAMDNSDRDLTQQIRYSVQVNKQFPEHFTFTGKQYLYMLRNNKEGIQALENDNRVTVNKQMDEGGESSQE